MAAPTIIVALHDSTIEGGGKLLSIPRLTAFRIASDILFGLTVTDGVDLDDFTKEDIDALPPLGA